MSRDDDAKQLEEVQKRLRAKVAKAAELARAELERRGAGKKAKKGKPRKRS